MKVHEYTQVQALDDIPSGPFVGDEERRSVLDDALRGVELGTYDRRMEDWVVKFLDDETVRVIVSWLERVRTAGVVTGVVDMPETLGRHGRRDETPPLWSAGNSGPGGQP